MPTINIWIHVIWSTKNRNPFLNRQVRSTVISHIRENARKKGIHLDYIHQEKHHKKQSFAEEHQLFVEKLGDRILGKTRD